MELDEVCVRMKMCQRLYVYCSVCVCTRARLCTCETLKRLERTTEWLWPRSQSLEKLQQWPYAFPDSRRQKNVVCWQGEVELNRRSKLTSHVDKYKEGRCRLGSWAHVDPIHIVIAQICRHWQESCQKADDMT